MAVRLYSRTLRGVTPAVSLVASIFALVVAVYGLAEGRARESVNSQLYLEGAVVPGPCAALTKETPAGCSIPVAPSDKTMHLLRQLILFPTSFAPAGGTRYSVTMGPPAIGLSEYSEQIWQRSAKYLDVSRPEIYVTSAIPIVIMSSYVYNGKKYADISEYLIMYAIMKESHNVVPANLIFCGRLAFWPDFVVDPVVPAVIGYPDRPSKSVMFDCTFHATRFDIPQGQNSILTAEAVKAASGQRFPSGHFPTMEGLKIVAHPPIGKTTALRTSELPTED